MATFNLDLGSFKSSGIYSFEFDVSQQPTIETSLIRLVVGFSRKGHFNTAIYLPDAKTCKAVYGDIDTQLEKRGSFFHRALYTCLESGPVFALNLMPVNNAKTADGQEPDITNYMSFSLSPTEKNGESKDELYSSFFNKERFWKPDTEYLLANVNKSASNRGKILNFVNLGQIPISILIKKSSPIGQFNITAAEWFGSKEAVPSYIEPYDYISDYFVDVAVVQGNWTNYAKLAIDPIYSEYFNNKGIKKNKLKDFLSLSHVINYGVFTGSVIPELRDSNGSIYTIDAVINNSISTEVGVLCALDKESLEEYNAQYANADYDDSICSLDLVGHTLANTKEIIGDINSDKSLNDVVNYLSYEFGIKSSYDIPLNMEHQSAGDVVYDALTQLKNNIKVANAHLGKMSGYMNNKIIISKPGNDDPKNVVFYDTLKNMLIANNSLLVQNGDTFRVVSVNEASNELHIVFANDTLRLQTLDADSAPKIIKKVESDVVEFDSTQTGLPTWFSSMQVAEATTTKSVLVKDKKGMYKYGDLSYTNFSEKKQKNFIYFQSYNVMGENFDINDIKTGDTVFYGDLWEDLNPAVRISSFDVTTKEMKFTGDPSAISDFANGFTEPRLVKLSYGDKYAISRLTFVPKKVTLQEEYAIDNKFNVNLDDINVGSTIFTAKLAQSDKQRVLSTVDYNGDLATVTFNGSDSSDFLSAYIDGKFVMISNLDGSKVLYCGITKEDSDNTYTIKKDGSFGNIPFSDIEPEFIMSAVIQQPLAVLNTIDKQTGVITFTPSNGVDMTEYINDDILIGGIDGPCQFGLNHSPEVSTPAKFVLDSTSMGKLTYATISQNPSFVSLNRFRKSIGEELKRSDIFSIVKIEGGLERGESDKDYQIILGSANDVDLWDYKDTDILIEHTNSSFTKEYAYSKLKVTEKREATNSFKLKFHTSPIGNLETNITLDTDNYWLVYNLDTGLKEETVKNGEVSNNMEIYRKNKITSIASDGVFRNYKDSIFGQNFEANVFQSGDKVVFFDTTYYIRISEGTDKDGFRYYGMQLYLNAPTEIKNSAGVVTGLNWDSEVAGVHGILRKINGSKSFNISVIDTGISDDGSSRLFYDRITPFEISADKKTIWINESDDTKLMISDYVVASYMLDDGETIRYKLSRVNKKNGKSTTYPGKIEISLNEPVFVDESNNIAQIIRFSPIDEYAQIYKFTSLTGFKMNKFHMPDGSDKQLANILKVLDPSNSNLMEVLKSRDIIKFRYLIDTFDGGIANMTFPKTYLTRLAKERQKCLAIMNFPSFRAMAKSDDPSFSKKATDVDPKPIIDTYYIAKGGNLDLNPSYTLSLPDENNGAKFSGYFSPFLMIRENGRNFGVPPSPDVSNLFVAKHKAGTPFHIVAGKKRGAISNPKVVGLEYDFLDRDRDNLEPMGVNPIVMKSGAPTIYANQMAYQKTQSAFNSLHVRDVLITIEEAIEQLLENYIFDFVNSVARIEIKTKVESYLDKVRSLDGIYAYEVIMDSKNNTDEVINARAAILDVAVEPQMGMQKMINRVHVYGSGGIEQLGFNVSV